MHETLVKSILSPDNGMNLYRGCTHGCIYCDARSTCYQIRHKFEDIEVKANAVELLERALKGKRKKCMIGTGGMSDPYLHLEKQLGHTRRCLELIDQYGFGLSIQTKSDMILRGILSYCEEARVYGVLFFNVGVTLRDGDRQYFYEQLDRHFPGLKEKYIRTFGNAYDVPSPDNSRLSRMVREECRRMGIVCGVEKLFKYMHEFEDKQAGVQISLFD